MNLTVGERLTLAQMLPRVGNVATLRIVQDLARELSFDEEEAKRIGLKVEDGRAVWKPDAEEKDISFGEIGTDLVVKELKQMDEGSKLGMEHLTLWDKFIESSQNGKHPI